MVFLLFLLLVSSYSWGMESALVSTTALVSMLREGQDQKVIDLVAAGALINTPDAQGSYLLHWAVLFALQKVSSPNWQDCIEPKMKVVDALFKFGADYTLHEEGSKRTAFHVLAQHLSHSTDKNKIVLSVFDRMLQGICKVWFLKVPTKEQGETGFIQEMSKVCSYKNKAGRSVVDIATDKKCVNFFCAEHFRQLYETALTERATDVDLANNKGF